MGGRRLILIPQRPGSIESEGKRVGKPRSRFRSAPKLRESHAMPQNRRSKVPQKRRFEKSPASVVLLHRRRRGIMTEHAGFQFLLQAISLAANVDGDG